MVVESQVRGCGQQVQMGVMASLLGLVFHLLVLVVVHSTPWTSTVIFEFPKEQEVVPSIFCIHFTHPNNWTISPQVYY